MRDSEIQFFSTIKSGGEEYCRVLTKLVLPRKMSESLVLHFFPGKETGKSLDGLFEFSLSAEIKGFNGVLEKTICSNRVYWESSSTRWWAGEICEQQLTGSPQDLLISYVRPGLQSSKEGVSGSFYLTPCEYLRPHKSFTYLGSGEVNVRTGKLLEFTLRNGVNLIFDSVYKSEDTEEGECVSFSELIAKFKNVSGAAAEIERDYLDDLNDFLWLVSFAHRKRCVCVGWEVNDSKGIHTFYRRGITIPSFRAQNSNETLITGLDFVSFLKVAYAKFIKTEPREFILQAIFAVTGENNTIEERFSRLFSALETLVLKYRRDSDAEFILAPNDWKAIQEDLKKTIKTHPLLSDKKGKRSQIYEKLPELNRVSFQTAFKEFCKFHSIKIDDLWPVCEGNDAIPLMKIRNRLVHGEPFSLKQLMVLSKATNHLEWIVERIVLAVLDWPVSNSRVADFYLSKMESYLNWKGASLD